MIIKATRVLTYIGSEDWILATFGNNQVKGTRSFPKLECKIVEESITYYHSELRSLDDPWLTDEIGPEAESVPPESLMPQPTMYGVGLELAEGIKFTRGPLHHLSEIFRYKPEYPNEYIYQVDPTGEANAIMRWHEEAETWMAIR